MKSNLKILLFVLAIASYNGCKKDEDDSSTTPAPTPVNKLCDGNGSTSFFPLDSTNSWTYDFTIAGQGQSTDPTIYVTGHATHNGKTYARTHEGTPFMQGDDRDLREDATTHNIYFYNDYDDVEYLEVPATPTLNQSWSISATSGYTKKVTNLSASLTTSGCSYTGLLEISELDASSVVKDKYYYKKGIGLVSKQDTGTFGSIFKVNAVTLK